MFQAQALSFKTAESDPVNGLDGSQSFTVPLPIVPVLVQPGQEELSKPGFTTIFLSPVTP